MIIMILAALTMIPIFGLWGFLELKHIVKKEYIIESPDIPESLDGKKLALISDQHGIFQGEDNKRVFDILDNVSPDLIVIAGDMVNGRGKHELRYVSRFLKRTSKYDVPVIYTFGNHEEKMHKHHPRAYKRLKRIAKARSILLNNRAYCPKDMQDVMFVGLNLPLEMYHAHDEENLIYRRTKRIIRRYDEKYNGSTTDPALDKRYKILIAHDPEHLLKYSESGYNLCLSGHLHGGIIRIPFLGGLVTPRFQFFHKVSKGYFETGKMKTVVSGGVGWHDIPLRIFNKPEIPVIIFKRTTN